MNILTELFSCQGRDVVEDGNSNGFQYAIVDGPYCYCAYVAIPKSHKYYGVPYDDIPLICNGGLTFGNKYKDIYILGWDYGHGWNLEHGPTITEIDSEVLDVTEQLLQ